MVVRCLPLTGRQRLADNTILTSWIGSLRKLLNTPVTIETGVFRHLSLLLLFSIVELVGWSKNCLDLTLAARLAKYKDTIAENVVF